jgi:signal peptidase I
MDIICNGPSMKPTLLPGDKIEVEEVAFKELERGDIIVYDNPENIRTNVIHRIIGSDYEGLITRGDNNSKIDPYRVRPEHRPLKVISFERGSLKFSVSNHGMLEHRLRLMQKEIRNFKNKYLHPIYAKIADSKILHPVGKLFNTEVREFKRPKGIELQLFLGKRRIGIFDSEAEKWRISFPWRLFIKAPDK